MKLFNLAYTENKTDVVAPPQCLFVLDLWVLKGYLFVLYLKSPIYFRWIEKMNADRMVKLLKDYSEASILKEEQRKKFKEISELVEKQTDDLIINHIIKEKRGDHPKKSKNRRKRKG